MPAFEYTALLADGTRQKGVREADSARQVRQDLRELGLFPTSVTEVTGGGRTKRRFAWQPASTLSAVELALMTRQLATLIEAGLPVEEALKAASEQSEKEKIKKILLAVRASVMEGSTFANALKRFPKVFSGLFSATVAAGEQSGHLEHVLIRLAEYTENRHMTQQKVQQALVYPVLLTVVSTAIVIGLLTYVVPSVVEVFRGTGQALPIITRGLIATSDFLRDNGLWVLLILGLMGVGGRQLLKIPTIRFQFHALILRTPGIAKFLRRIETARFTRTLSILNASSVPLLESLRISASVIQNLAMRQAVMAAMERVREGKNLHTALKESGYFPPIVIHMIASGEASGHLDDMLRRVAVFEEHEYEATINTLLGLLGPVLVLGMGAVVLLIVLAILLPIFELNQLVN